MQIHESSYAVIRYNRLHNIVIYVKTLNRLVSSFNYTAGHDSGGLEEVSFNHICLDGHLVEFLRGAIIFQSKVTRRVYALTPTHLTMIN